MLTLDFVKIDLSVFFDDFREKSLIRINSNWKYVEDLQKHVEKLFNLSAVLFVNKDGYFLHPKEDIDIVKINNDLRAVASNDVFDDNKTKKSKSRSDKTDASETVNDPTCINESKKKRKLQNLQEDLSTSTPKDVKRYKKHISRCVEITSTSETIIKQSTHVESELGMLTLSLIAPEKNSKNKKKSKAVTDDKKPNKSKQNHIYFNESGERISTTSQKKNKKSPEKDSSKVLFRCALNNDDDATPRLWNTEIFKKSDNTPKILENILLKSKNEPITVENRTTDGKIEVNAKENVNVTTDGIQENNLTIESKSEENVKASNNAIADEVTPPMVRVEGGLEPKEMAKDESVSICVDISMEEEEESINESPEKTTDNSTTTTTIKHDNHMMPPVAIVNGVNRGKHRTTEREVKENDTTSNNATNDEETSSINVEDYTVNKNTPECIDLSMEAKEESTEEYPQLKSTNNTPRSVKHQIQVDSDLFECIDLNKTDDDTNDVENSKDLSSLLRTENIKIDKILPYCVDIQDNSPHLEDILLFKFPYVNKKQQTLHTEAMAGKCKHINKRTKLIKILILDGFNALQHVPQKFISITDDSLTSVQYLQVKLTDLTDVKILSMT